MSYLVIQWRRQVRLIAIRRNRREPATRWVLPKLVLGLHVNLALAGHGVRITRSFLALTQLVMRISQGGVRRVGHRQPERKVRLTGTVMATMEALTKSKRAAPRPQLARSVPSRHSRIEGGYARPDLAPLYVKGLMWQVCRPALSWWLASGP
jgi:hypothetical protein